MEAAGTLLTKLGNYLINETHEETEEEKQARLRRHAKLSLLAKSQRSVILEDLEHSIQALHHFVEMKSRKGDDNKDNQISQAAMMESTDDQKRLILNDELAVVNTLSNNIDRCLSHGLRPVENDEENTVKFFGLAKWTCTRVEALRQKQMINAMKNATTNKNTKVCELVTSSVAPDLPRNVRGFFAAVRAANGLTTVHSDEGKARAFIRQCLNTHLLRDCMSFILAETNIDLLTSYYTEFALFRQRDDVKVFLGLLNGLDKISFAFMIEDMRLDMSPDSSPFSRPLPRPKAQKFKKVAPKLIDPEDMVSGRVHLCQEDDETNLLTEKLMTHHQLRSTFNTSTNGNPLSEVLKKAQQTQKLEDAAVAILRFLELGYAEYDVFGTELLDVLCNPFLSGMARFDPAMGIPDVMEACICYLHNQLQTPGLFQMHLHADHVIELRDTVEELGGFHRHMTVDAHEICAVLLQYLWELPDPILTEDRIENFHSCIRMDASKEEKTKQLRVLVNDLPWYSKPLLERLLHLFEHALLPENTQHSGLSIHSLSMTLAPLIFRAAHSFRFNEYEDAQFRRYPNGYHSTTSTSMRLRIPPEVDDSAYPGLIMNEKERIAAETRAFRHAKRDAEESAALITLLIEQQQFILQDFRKDLALRRDRLQTKVFFLETLRFKMEEPIDLTNLHHVFLLKRLWEGLLSDPQVEENEHFETDKDFSTIDVQSLLQSKRWLRSGFHTENPLGSFRGGGLLSLECLVYFVHEYPEKAKHMMERNALPGGSRYPFPVASINVMRMMMKLLMLDEAPEVCSKLVLHTETGSDTVLKMKIAERVSRAPFWRVFDDKEAFVKLHSMAFMLLDLHWIHSGATQMSFNPVLDSTRKQMGWLLEQAPENVEDMWIEWMKVREQHASKYGPSDVDSSVNGSSVINAISNYFGFGSSNNNDETINNYMNEYRNAQEAQALHERDELARQIVHNLEQKQRIKEAAAQAKEMDHIQEIQMTNQMAEISLSETSTTTLEDKEQKKEQNIMAAVAEKKLLTVTELPLESISISSNTIVTETTNESPKASTTSTTRTMTTSRSSSTSIAQAF